MKKKDIIISTVILYRDIDKCICDLVDARMNRNRMMEEDSLLRMESLMVGTMQQLDCIIGFMKEES